MTKTLDDRDRRILTLLQTNARTPLAALARDIGLSRSATNDRLRRLERSGVIQGYHAVVAETGEPGFTAWLLLELKPGTRCLDVTPRLLKMSGVVVCYSLSGAVDLLVLTQTNSFDRLSQLREMVAELDAIHSVSTAPVMQIHRPG